MNKTSNQSLNGFTIVELLAVIVVIGVLAAITFFSYKGITEQAIIASLKSDLTGAVDTLKIKKIKLGFFPTTIDCNQPNSVTNLCLQASEGSIYTNYQVDDESNPQHFKLTETKSGISYNITDDGSIASGPSVPFNSSWLTIGSQTWAKTNLNVGTMVTHTVDMTNNSILEKYCYNNLESNCTTYGALYQWNEAMQYTTTEGAQGICPAGMHIPTYGEWMVLANYLGYATAGIQLQPGGSSGLDIPYAGTLSYSGQFYSSLGDIGSLLSSSSKTIENQFSAFRAHINLGYDTLGGGYGPMSGGVSVRCLRD